MTTVAQPTTTSKISLEVARMVAAGLKIAQPGNSSLWRALDKAVELMEQGHPMELRGNVLHVASASQPGIDYATMLNECPCMAQAGVCWHRAALALLVSIQTIEAAAQVCQPLVAKPRRGARARPTTSRVELAQELRAWREQRGITRETSQAELEAACNW